MLELPLETAEIRPTNLAHGFYLLCPRAKLQLHFAASDIVLLYEELFSLFHPLFVPGLVLLKYPPAALTFDVLETIYSHSLEKGSFSLVTASTTHAPA